MNTFPGCPIPGILNSSIRMAPRPVADLYGRDEGWTRLRKVALCDLGGGRVAVPDRSRPRDLWNVVGS